MGSLPNNKRNHAKASNIYMQIRRIRIIGPPTVFRNFVIQGHTLKKTPKLEVGEKYGKERRLFGSIFKRTTTLETKGLKNSVPCETTVKIKVDRIFLS